MTLIETGKEAIPYPTKTVAKRAIFDIIPDKVRIVQKETDMGAHQKKKKKKNGKVLKQARSNCKKAELRQLIRNSFKIHNNHRRRKGHMKRTPFANGATSATDTNTVAKNTTTTATAAAAAALLLLLSLLLLLPLLQLVLLLHLAWKWSGLSQVFKF